MTTLLRRLIACTILALMAYAVIRTNGDRLGQFFVEVLIGLAFIALVFGITWLLTSD